MPQYPNSRHRSGPLHIDKRMAAAGLVAGAALGVWAGRQARSMTAPVTTPRAETGEPVSMIDWKTAADVAIRMNRTATLTATERARLDRYYRELEQQCIPLVAAYTGSSLPEQSVERTFAFDRVDWINANLEAFRVLFAPLEELGGTQTATGGITGALNSFNRRIVSLELGALVGYLARRVLGQYDLALLGREPIDSGKLYYVEPNIRSVEESLALPADDFRMWLALHETTHAFEFEAHPWVRTYFNGLLNDYLEYLRKDADHLKQGLRGLRIFVDRARNRDDREGAWIEALMSPEQRAIFTKMQAMMCVVEGYSNHVMNAVGRDLLSTYDQIARKFERRQRNRTPAEKLVARLTGLDVKLEQYRLGEAFVDAIVEARGHETARRIWDHPSMLPTMAELRTPQLWLDRIDTVAAPAVQVGVEPSPAVQETREEDLRPS